MRSTAFAAAMLPLATAAVNVVLSNDDGWAEMNIRSLYDGLTDAGFNVILSAPADNESGTGSADAEPTTVGRRGCEFMSCPPGSPPFGYNASNPRFNYVNSFPVTSMRYGIQTLAPHFFGSAPDIALAGFNVGTNLGLTTQISGTVGAATEAAREGIPAIAFSGTTGAQVGWTTPLQTYQQVYADLSTTVTSVLVHSGLPYLPNNIWLNVNYPDVSDSICSSPSDFRFVLSRINNAVPYVTPKDVYTCHNDGRLPTETEVVDTEGCYASISVGVATTKLDAGAADQQVVLDKLESILSCLPA
ncbi:hypothetical protein BAUCODRAFT_71287 [Baudoinia panamericana UAMH 10762]|uniref:Survival protein SurE-like phosphatase/nucleotidase domain-containing protein n=1 Tax=Baudoinia panamericana (strain UAMH 10762) TaxID=717646 RepID=M2MW49_BAUPA|nr:uncharacterized protein BAUCODRAFT_71287 [Baudoinia panamericana UAMH 10762]EMC95773.1 hypothetical protein BAUCODRAFT_71287 [Baudoinia panamericana UAMH 10762]